MQYTSDRRYNLPSFNADHPFMFAIWDNASGTIIFSGRLMTVVGKEYSDAEFYEDK